MANTFFHFKKFSIHQDRCAMKVSTDAVVLGAFADHENIGKILDIGTGTGVISLMLAQRFPNCEINGVEIDSDAFCQAQENIQTSPWPNRISLYHESFQEFNEKADVQYDLIVTNPPYFPNHIKSSDLKRNLALHNDQLSFGDLIKGVKTLLKPTGLFWVILPPSQMRELEKIAAFFNLYPKKNIQLKDNPSQKVLREIKVFAFSKQDILDKEELTIKNKDGSFSAPYKKLLAEFFLNF